MPEKTATEQGLQQLAFVATAALIYTKASEAWKTKSVMPAVIAVGLSAGLFLRAKEEKEKEAVEGTSGWLGNLFSNDFWKSDFGSFVKDTSFAVGGALATQYAGEFLGPDQDNQNSAQAIQETWQPQALPQRQPEPEPQQPSQITIEKPSKGNGWMVPALAVGGTAFAAIFLTDWQSLRED